MFICYILALQKTAREWFVNHVVSKDRQLIQPAMQEYATENHLIPMWFSSTPLTVIKV